MHFNEFDSIMRVYEESLDQYILPDMYIAVRLDGRSFTGLTKRMNYEKAMGTMQSLMNQLDEIYKKKR